MKNKINFVVVGYICTLILVFILSLFPGYNDLFSGEPIKTVPVGQFYYTIASLLSGKFVIDMGNGEYFYTPAQSVLSGLASLLFLLLAAISAVFFVVLAIKKKKIPPASFAFLFAFIAHIPTIVVKMRLEPHYNSFNYRFDIVLGVIALIALLVDIARFCLWLYRKRPPRPHKPTDKERIAELEKRVQELESKN